MPELDDLITTARDAYQRRDWNVASRNFTAALRQSQQGPAQLGPADLEGLADSAWWLGDVPESLAAAEELYRRQDSEGEPASAAMTAIVLALRWGTRGDLAVASGWLNRARRLLQGITECPEAGYLLYLEAAMSMDLEGDPAAAAEAAGKVEALSRRFADPALACFARVLSAIALVREGRTDAGFNDLDEAMLPVLAGDVAPEWAGDIYCTVVHLCHELGDLARMRAWTAALERWTAGLSSTFVYADVTRVHELQLLSAEGNWDAVERVNRSPVRRSSGPPPVTTTQRWSTFGWRSAKAATLRAPACASRLPSLPQPQDIRPSLRRSVSSWNGQLSGSRRPGCRPGQRRHGESCIWEPAGRRKPSAR